jgi:hypothetical protein
MAVSRWANRKQRELRRPDLARSFKGNNILGSPEPGLGSPKGCKIVAGGRRDHRKGIPSIFSTVTGCQTLRVLKLKSGHPFQDADKSILFPVVHDHRLLSRSPSGCPDALPKPTRGKVSQVCRYRFKAQAGNADVPPALSAKRENLDWPSARVWTGLPRSQRNVTCASK